MSFAEGQTIAGRYVLRRLLGAGGMGAVWVAEDTRLRTEVAVKFVLPQVNGAEIVERFRREAEIVAQIRSPNVVQIIDVGIDEAGRDFLAMELLVGEDFGSLLARREIIPIEEAVPIVAQAARGLSRAHSQGVVHRDVKPENIFLCGDDMGLSVKVLDFGIAKAGPSSQKSNLTSMGTIIGTPDYMAPEQVMNEGPCTPATDLYALAAVLYRSITGTVPFVGRSMTEQLVRITTDPLRPPSTLNPGVPPALDAWFETALAKNPLARPVSAKAFVDTLLAATEGGAGPARMFSASWTDISRVSSLPHISTPPGGLPIIRGVPPGTTKALVLDTHPDEALEIPVGSRTGIFVVAGLAGLLVAGGIVMAMLRGGSGEGGKPGEVAAVGRPTPDTSGAPAGAGLAGPSAVDAPPLPPVNLTPAGSVGHPVAGASPAVPPVHAIPVKGGHGAKTHGKGGASAATSTKKQNDPDYY